MPPSDPATGAAQTVPMAGAWFLRMLDGPAPGMTWPLSTLPLRIGRSLGSHVRIENAHVSRLHCEVLLDDGAPCLRHRSARNATLLNGVPCAESALLHAGDTIALADVLLLLELGSPHDVFAAPARPSTPTTRPYAEAVHLQDRLDAESAAPDLTRDLHALFRLMRALGRIETLDTLVATVQSHLRERFAPAHCWFVWHVAPTGELVLYPPAVPEDTCAVPAPAIREACESRVGLLLPPDPEAGAGGMLVAPMVHGQDAFGAIVLRRDAGEAAFAEDDLEYLLAAADGAAPMVRAVERLEQLQRDARALHADQPGQSRMLGGSTRMAEVRKAIRQAAQARANVWIAGETGVGKELAARMIHDLGDRASGPYITVNCAAIPESLFESECFGHEAGAFTGAGKRRKGLFEQAHGGTLFLDEIEELAPVNQGRLLRATETGIIRRVGGETEILVDVRIVCATNKTWAGASPEQFRRDLYYRLAGIVLGIPPLRERPEDIIDLANHFLRHASAHAAGQPRRLSRDAETALQRYDWPGNVRELRSTIERACYLAHDEWITPASLQLGPARGPVALESSPRTLREVERQYLAVVLEKYDGNVAEAARALGLSRSTLYYKLARHGIRTRDNA